MQKNELNYLLKPIGMLAVLIVLFLMLSLIGFKKLSLTYASINESKDLQAKLSEKVNILETVSQVLREDVSFIDVALPKKGALLYGLSQVRKQAAAHNVLVSSLKAGSTSLEENGISKTSITFEANGTDSDIYPFLNSFYKTLPIMNLEKVKINKVDSVTQAIATLYVYSASLPEKIPSITESIDGFTPQDVATIRELSSFTVPDFFEPKPTTGEVREDPFN